MKYCPVILLVLTGITRTCMDRLCFRLVNNRNFLQLIFVALYAHFIKEAQKPHIFSGNHHHYPRFLKNFYVSTIHSEYIITKIIIYSKVLSFCNDTSVPGTGRPIAKNLVKETESRLLQHQQKIIYWRSALHSAYGSKYYCTIFMFRNLK